MAPMNHATNDTSNLLQRARHGDPQATSDLLSKYHDRLRKMVRLRLDRRLCGQVDPSEIVLQATLDAVRRMSEYHEPHSAGFYLWLRSLAGEKLVDAHRRHLGAQEAGAGHEVSLYRGAMPEANSMALAAQLLGRSTTVYRADMQLKVQEAMNSLDPMDREVLVLRHFEHLSIQETAQVMEVKTAEASARYIAALKRMQQVLSCIPGFRGRG
jgi:RNA polymerase sigma-70 factor (ECF subfamily)